MANDSPVAYNVQIIHLLSKASTYVYCHNLFQQMDVRLSYQREKVQDGAVPLPLYTAIRVKPKVPATKYHGMYQNIAPEPIGFNG